MRPISTTVLIVVWIGILLGLAFSAAILFDVWLYETGRKTISDRLLNAGIQANAIGFVVCFVFMFVFSALAAHLFDPIHYKTQLWVWALCGSLLGVIIGFFFGHHFFGQTVD